VSNRYDRPRGQPAPRALAARPSTSRPGDVMRDLITLLRGHGLTRLYWSACTIFAVLSVTRGLTVWCDGRHLTWKHEGVATTWPAADTEGAATRLAKLARPQQAQP
jgi:hypothetical protein